MRINPDKTRVNQRAKSKVVIWASCIVAALLLVGGVYYYFIRKTLPTDTYSPRYPISSQTPTTNQEQKGDTAAEQPSSTTTEQVPAATTGSIRITDLVQEKGFVNIGIEVSNFTVSKCVLSFTSDGAKPIVREQSGGCHNTSIPQVEFEKIGDYTLTVTAYSASDKIQATQEINVQ